MFHGNVIKGPSLFVRRCGLKYLLIGFILGIYGVTFCTKVWIEMCVAGVDANARKVTFCTKVWIEMLPPQVAQVYMQSPFSYEGVD